MLSMVLAKLCLNDDLSDNWRRIACKAGLLMTGSLSLTLYLTMTSCGANPTGGGRGQGANAQELAGQTGGSLGDGNNAAAANAADSNIPCTKLGLDTPNQNAPAQAPPGKGVANGIEPGPPGPTQSPCVQPPINVGVDAGNQGSGPQCAGKGCGVYGGAGYGGAAYGGYGGGGVQVGVGVGGGVQVGVAVGGINVGVGVPLGYGHLGKYIPQCLQPICTGPQCVPGIPPPAAIPPGVPGAIPPPAYQGQPGFNGNCGNGSYGPRWFKGKC